VKESLPSEDEPSTKGEASKPECQEPVVQPQREVEQVKQQEEEEEKVSMRSQPHPLTSGAAGNQDMGNESDT
jgi:hypothetical protein